MYYMTFDLFCLYLVKFGQYLNNLSPPAEQRTPSSAWTSKRSEAAAAAAAAIGQRGWAASKPSAPTIDAKALMAAVRTKTHKNRASPKTHVQTNQASRGNSAASYARDAARARQFPGTIRRVPAAHTAARRRFLVNAAVPRTWPRRPGLIARGASRATEPGLSLTKAG